MATPRYELKLTPQERIEFSQIFTLEQILLLDRDNRKRTVDGVRFERFVGYLFEQEGYKVWTTRRVGDGGVDLFVRKKTLEYIVQCKRIEKGVVKPNDVWAIPTVMERFGVRKAFLVTTGRVSSNTKKVVKNSEIEYKEKDELVRWARRVGGAGFNQPEKSAVLLWLEKNQHWLSNPRIALAFLTFSVLFFLLMVVAFFLIASPNTSKLPAGQTLSGSSKTTSFTLTASDLTPQIINTPVAVATPTLPVAATPTPLPPDEAAQPCKTGQVKGNANPGSGFYHEPGWIYYATVRPPEYTVRCFDNALTAQAAGFKRGDTRTPKP